MINQSVYNFNNKWTFCDENNKPTGLEFETLEQAINALIQYFKNDFPKNRNTCS